MSIRIKRKFGIEEDLCEKKYSRLEDSLVEQLPTEIWGKVIGHLDPLSLTKLAMTDSYFSTLANDNRVWKRLYQRDFPSKYQKKMEYRDLFKSVSWKDSYNADCKVPITLKWQNRWCDFCVRRVPLRCSCVIKKVEMKKYFDLKHARFHLDSHVPVSFFTSKGHIDSSKILSSFYDQGVTEFNVCSIRKSKLPDNLQVSPPKRKKIEFNTDIKWPSTVF